MYIEKFENANSFSNGCSCGVCAAPKAGYGTKKFAPPTPIVNLELANIPTGLAVKEVGNSSGHLIIIDKNTGVARKNTGIVIPGLQKDWQGKVKEGGEYDDNGTVNVIHQLPDQPRTKNPGPTKIDFKLALAYAPDGQVRLVAVDPTSGKRIENGNIVKFLDNGTMYWYKTIEPRLGLPLNLDGSLVRG